MNAEGEREMYDDRCGVETGGEIQGGFGEENGPINIRRGETHRRNGGGRRANDADVLQNRSHPAHG